MLVIRKRKIPNFSYKPLFLVKIVDKDTGEVVSQKELILDKDGWSSHHDIYQSMVEYVERENRKNEK